MEPSHRPLWIVTIFPCLILTSLESMNGPSRNVNFADQWSLNGSTHINQHEKTPVHESGLKAEGNLHEMLDTYNVIGKARVSQGIKLEKNYSAQFPEERMPQKIRLKVDTTDLNLKENEYLTPTQKEPLRRISRQKPAKSVSEEAKTQGPDIQDIRNSFASSTSSGGTVTNEFPQGRPPKSRSIINKSGPQSPDSNAESGHRLSPQHVDVPETTTRSIQHAIGSSQYEQIGGQESTDMSEIPQPKQNKVSVWTVLGLLLCLKDRCW